MTCALVKPTSGYSTFSRFVSLTVRRSIWTSTDVSLATFAHHIAGRLVDAKALEGRRAQLPAARPLHELELGHDLRLDEVRGLRRRPEIERVLVGGQRFEPGVELVQDLVGEARADLARVDKLAVLVVTDEQRAGIALAFAFALEPPTDDQLLAVVVLDLLPRAGSLALLVLRVQPLGHDSFEARLRARVLHRLPATALVRRRLPRRPGQLELAQRSAPFRIWLLHQRVPVLPHHVEEHVGDRHLLHLAADLVLCRQADPLLDLLEARPALRVEGHDLAVEDD